MREFHPRPNLLPGRGDGKYEDSSKKGERKNIKNSEKKRRSQRIITNTEKDAFSFAFFRRLQRNQRISIALPRHKLMHCQAYH